MVSFYFPQLPYLAEPNKLAENSKPRWECVGEKDISHWPCLEEGWLPGMLLLQYRDTKQLRRLLSQWHPRWRQSRRQPWREPFSSVWSIVVFRECSFHSLFVSYDTDLLECERLTSSKSNDVSTLTSHNILLSDYML